MANPHDGKGPTLTCAVQITNLEIGVQTQAEAELSLIPLLRLENLIVTNIIHAAILLHPVRPLALIHTLESPPSHEE